MIGKRDQKALVAGAAVVGGLLIGLRGAPYWVEWRATEIAAANEAVARVAETERTVAAFPALVDSLAERSARLITLGRSLLVVDSLPALSGSLVGLIAERARAASITIDSLRVGLVDGDTTALPRVALRLRATTDIAGLVSLLEQIEQEEPVLSITDLQVQAESVEGGTDRAEQLNVWVTVEALGLVRHRGTR